MKGASRVTRGPGDHLREMPQLLGDFGRTLVTHEPPIGKGTSPITRPSSSATWPPPISASRATLPPSPWARAVPERPPPCSCGHRGRRLTRWHPARDRTRSRSRGLSDRSPGDARPPRCEPTSRPGPVTSMTTSLVDSDLGSVPITLARPPAGGCQVERTRPGCGPGALSAASNQGWARQGRLRGTTRPLVATRRPACQTRAGSKVVISSNAEHVCLVAGCQTTQMVEMVVLGRVARRQHQGVLQLHPAATARTHAVVDMAVAKEACLARGRPVQRATPGRCRGG